MFFIPRHSELPTLWQHPRTFLSRYRYSLAVLAVGAVLDALTTYANVRQFGPHVETHPVQRLFFETFGPSVGVPLAKLIQFVFVIRRRVVEALDAVASAALRRALFACRRQ